MANLRGNQFLRSLDTLAGRLGILGLTPVSLRGRNGPVPGAPRRILLIKLAAIGDTLLLTPTFRALRDHLPEAQLTLVGTAVNQAIAAELPWIDRFLCLDPPRAVRDPRYFARFLAELREEPPEVAIDFEQWPHVTPLLARLSGARVRIGFRTHMPVRHLLYTHPVRRDSRAHEALNFSRLLGPLGIESVPLLPEVPVRDDLLASRREAMRDAGWNGHDPVVLVHPGCGHAHARAWPVDRYAEVCARMTAAQPAFFVFTGAGDEVALAQRLAAGLPGASLAAVGIDVPAFVAQVQAADVTVSGNTGAMHVAAALGKPQLVLEGPNDPAKWGPLNSRARIVRSSCPGCPCLDMGWEFHRTDGFCMEQISVDSALEALMPMVAAAVTGGPGDSDHPAPDSRLASGAAPAHSAAAR